MSAELAITLPVALIAGILAYISAQINSDEAGLKSFFTSMSLLFTGGTLFTVAKVADSTGYGDISSVMWQMFVVWVFIVFVFILYLFIMFMKDTVDLASMRRWR